ncbi:unnamed protein product [Vitrella brassicaformis CCMP3155]|uniref:Uncharacterized protein n=1 Tax=Vitrella brassicaformis (strain CCMP3155) TaxID=1169540 RepID=A0A0G4G918_VITBC|nr:unnamed protein product [Vitrella brassicaformis CCMP3155]|eukprot:CEM25063.1 unnamed protein product [Vitrella brassicaformis CCMP3155]
MAKLGLRHPPPEREQVAPPYPPPPPSHATAGTLPRRRAWLLGTFKNTAKHLGLKVPSPPALESDVTTPVRHGSIPLLSTFYISSTPFAFTRASHEMAKQEKDHGRWSNFLGELLPRPFGPSDPPTPCRRRPNESLSHGAGGRGPRIDDRFAMVRWHAPHHIDSASPDNKVDNNDGSGGGKGKNARWLPNICAAFPRTHRWLLDKFPNTTATLGLRNRPPKPKQAPPYPPPPPSNSTGPLPRTRKFLLSTFKNTAKQLALAPAPASPSPQQQMTPPSQPPPPPSPPPPPPPPKTNATGPTTGKSYSDTVKDSVVKEGPAGAAPVAATLPKREPPPEREQAAPYPPPPPSSQTAAKPLPTDHSFPSLNIQKYGETSEIGPEEAVEGQQAPATGTAAAMEVEDDQQQQRWRGLEARRFGPNEPPDPLPTKPRRVPILPPPETVLSAVGAGGRGQQQPPQQPHPQPQQQPQPQPQQQPQPAAVKEYWLKQQEARAAQHREDLAQQQQHHRQQIRQMMQQQAEMQQQMLEQQQALLRQHPIFSRHFSNRDVQATSVRR